MDLYVVIEALRAHEGQEVLIVTNSEYAINGAEKWVHRWQQKNWTKRRKVPVEHTDLWEELADLMTRTPTRFRWERRHNGRYPSEPKDFSAKSREQENGICPTPTHS
jgi:ribonuclease HI